MQVLQVLGAEWELSVLCAPPADATGVHAWHVGMLIQWHHMWTVSLGALLGPVCPLGWFLNAVCLVRLLLSESDGSPGCASSQEAVIRVRYSCDSHKRAQVGLWASSAFFSFLVLAVTLSLAILSHFLQFYLSVSTSRVLCLSLVSSKPVLITLS